MPDKIAGVDLYPKRGEMLWAQLATKVELDKIDKFMTSDYWMETKLDGYRVLLERTADGVKLWSRLTREKTGIAPHIEALFKSYPVGTLIDGEFVYPTVRDADGDILACDFTKISEVMNCDPAKGAKRQTEKEYGPVTFVIFDVLQFGDRVITNESNTRRRAVAEKIVESIVSDYVLIIKKRPVSKDMLDVVREAGGEGIMLKNADAIYEVGKKRAKTWYKAKLVEDADVVVTGFSAAEKLYTGNHKNTHTYWLDEDREVLVLTAGGKPKVGDPAYPEVTENCVPVTKYFFYGRIGAIEFGQYKDNKLVYRGRCSGITDELRKNMTDNPDEYIGKVMKIKHYGIQSDGGFRHPQFQDFRDDKSTEACEWDVA